MIFLAVEFHNLDHSTIGSSQDANFQRKFNVTKEPKRDTITGLFERFKHTRNVNDDATNIVHLHMAVTEANVKIVQQMIQL